MSTERPSSPHGGAQGKPIEPWTHVKRVVLRSRSSFTWGMKLLPADQRRAMYAIYAFCREVDDIADEQGAADDKRRALAAWRDEVDRLYAGEPRWPTTRALLGPVERFDLPRREFLAVIDGVETDVAPTVRMPRVEDLLSYCRKVAGAVGVLSIHAFGMPRHPGPRIAETLGNAFQLTNILRDLRDDAALERLYVPLDLLRENGVATNALHDASEGLPDGFADPGFARACGALAEMARGYYAEAERLLAEIEWRRLRPAVLMMAVYRELFDRLERRGWTRIDEPVRIPRVRKTWIVLRYGFF